MERTGFILKVRKDKIDEYKKQHKMVWPEMLEALKRSGWHNYSLFIRPDGLLFGYVEAQDSFRKCLERMKREDANSKWQKFMEPFFEQLEGRPDESMSQLEEVFHLS